MLLSLYHLCLCTQPLLLHLPEKMQDLCGMSRLTSRVQQLFERKHSHIAPSTPCLDKEESPEGRFQAEIHTYTHICQLPELKSISEALPKCNDSKET